MDPEDILAQDLVAKQWIEEIDSFKSPPPPRRLQDLNCTPAISQQQRGNSVNLSANNSSTTQPKDRSYSVDSGKATNGDISDNLPQRNFIIEKVRQFEDNDAHPYANSRRIETSKKIAVQGGGMAAFLVNDKGKQRISKEEASKLRASVLQENRVYNPYPNPYSGSVSGTDVNRRNDPSNSSSGSGTSSLLSQGKDSTSSLSTGIVRSNVNGEMSKTKVNNSQQVLYSRPDVQRSHSIPTATTPNFVEGPSSAIVYKNPSENTNGAGGHRKSSGTIVPLLSSRLEFTTNGEDDEMTNIYRNFDAEVKKFGVRQENPNKPINAIVEKIPTAVRNAPSPSYGQYRKQHYLPPYTGIRQQTSISGSTSALPPIPPLRNCFSPPADVQQQRSHQQQQQTNGRLSISDLPSRIPVRPETTTMAPPLPVRQPGSSWKRQEHYDVPNVLKKNSLNDLTAPLTSNQDNGYLQKNGGANVKNGNIPPPPPPPPSYGMVRHYGAATIVDRIPAHEAITSLANLEISGAKGGLSNNGITNGHAGSVPPPPMVHQQQRANSFSGALNRINNEKNVERTALERQQQMWSEFEKEVAHDLEKKAVPIGLCHICGGKVTNPLDATQALGHLYHAQCFTCCYCGKDTRKNYMKAIQKILLLERPLNGRKFYEARGKIYCEEDYLYSGFQHSAERCAACGHLIMEMILQAVGKSFHPGCFKCKECRRGLENVPFTVDDRGFIYCIDDYHRLFAPRCAKCGQPITPTSGREETVRVVAMQRDYHIDCYACEGCGLRLTDEDEKRCYPLGDHLLCQGCHIHWSRTGGASVPISDL